jgi:hypothetical protein
LLPFFTITLAALIGCASDGGSSSAGGGSSGGDGGVDCPSGPMAMLDVTVRAASGPVPPDTRVLVSWSAGAEPTFELDDPKTWGTPDANVVCDVDPDEPPPKDLAHLVCHLWTSGVTHVQVRASGYVPFEGMLKPKISAACKGPVPTDVSVTLKPVPDAGTGGAVD